MILLKEVGFNYPEKESIIDGINLSVKKGEIFGLVGASGGGKSTLLKLIAGFLNATKGEISWKGKRIVGPAYKLVPGNEHVELVNQDYKLDIYHTVRENLLVQMYHLDDEDRGPFADELLELMELTHRSNIQALSISGGEQQRLAIARALAKESDVLLLDEPFAHLDAHLRQKIGQYIKTLIKVRKTTCIFVSHDGSEVMQWCERIGFLNNGKLERIAAPNAFYYKPSSFFESRFFGEINRIKIQGKEVLFRPDEYKISKDSSLELTGIEAVFAGGFWKTYFKTNKKETIVLYGLKPLMNVRQIAIKRKK